MKRRLTTPSFLGAAVLLAASALPAQDAANPLKESELKKLGKPFGTWLEARVEGDAAKAEEARADLIDAVGDVQKRHKDVSILALPAVWNVVFDRFRPHDAKARKGKLVDLELLGGGTCPVRIPDGYDPKKRNHPGLLVISDRPAEEVVAGLPAEVLQDYLVALPVVSDLDEAALAGPDGQRRMLVPIGSLSLRNRLDRNRLFVLGEGERGARAVSRLVAFLPHVFAGAILIGGEADPAARSSPNVAFVPFHQAGELAQGAQWVLEAAPRDPYPVDFRIQLVDPGQGRYYWVQAMRFDTPPDLPEGKVAGFRVQVDREKNEIRIDSEYVYAFSFYLNDAIVDLDRKIVVVRNGVPYEFQASRSIGTMLDNFEKSLDHGMVFPAILRRLDVPEEVAVPEEG